MTPKYTTLDGKPLTGPWHVSLVHHGGGITTLLLLDGVFVLPDPVNTNPNR